MSKETSRNIEDFCRNIAYLRKKNGLTQKQMAKIMGTSVYSIRLLEHGVMPEQLPYTVLYPLHEYFGVSVDALFLPME